MRRFWWFCAVAVLFPYVFTLVASGGIHGIGGGTRVGSFGEEAWESGRRVYLEGRGFVDGEEYLVGVVARQMPADYEPEALKAQAIVARTFLYRQMGDEREIWESDLNLRGWGRSRWRRCGEAPDSWSIMRR